MQFSIGLIKLNLDGTPQVGEDGKEILTYSNFDISEYAKIYTGMERNDWRGNLDGSNNQVDPMKINWWKKDHQPKVG